VETLAASIKGTNTHPLAISVPCGVIEGERASVVVLLEEVDVTEVPGVGRPDSVVVRTLRLSFSSAFWGGA